MRHHSHTNGKIYISKKIFFRFAAILFIISSILFFFYHPNRFYEVIAGSLYRGTQLSPDDLGNIINKEGIKTIINLRDEKNGKRWLDHGERICAQYKAVLLNFDTEANKLPKYSVCQGVINALTKVEGPILIHSLNSLDMTGFFSGLALCLKKDPPLSVIEDQFSLRFGLIPLFRSVGPAILSKYKDWLQKRSKSHSRKTLFYWMKNEYTSNLATVQYYIDGINQNYFNEEHLRLNDALDTITVHGWAFSFPNKEPPDVFKIFIDKQPLPEVIFNRNRKDVVSYYGLEESFKQSCMFGWEVSIPKNSLSKGKHSISLKIGSNGNEMISINNKAIFYLL